MNNAYIKLYERNEMGGFFMFKGDGKILNVNIEIGNECYNNIFLGTLEQLKQFYESINLAVKAIFSCNKKIKNIIILPRNLEIKKDDERTFSQIGIREDFQCKVNLF